MFLVYICAIYCMEYTFKGLTLKSKLTEHLVFSFVTFDNPNFIDYALHTKPRGVSRWPRCLK